MEKIEYRNIYENEANHFFYVSTHLLVINLIKRFTRGRQLHILDAGCGTGGLAIKLAAIGKVWAIDASQEAIRFAKKRGVGAKLAGIEKIPFPEKTFDVVTSIDVIYHKKVKDDVLALKEVRRVLKPGGVFVLRVPANQYLMSAHDRHVHTARRYQRDELIGKIKKAGLSLRQISFVHSPIFLLSLGRIFFERFTNEPDSSAVGNLNPVLNKCLTGVLNLEASLISRGIPLPVGQGLIAVAIRKG
jgi:SAM-dependent methyltransferase